MQSGAWWSIGNVPVFVFLAKAKTFPSVVSCNARLNFTKSGKERRTFSWFLSYKTRDLNQKTINEIKQLINMWPSIVDEHQRSVTTNDPFSGLNERQSIIPLWNNGLHRRVGTGFILLPSTASIPQSKTRSLRPATKNCHPSSETTDAVNLDP